MIKKIQKAIFNIQIKKKWNLRTHKKNIHKQIVIKTLIFKKLRINYNNNKNKN